MDADRLLWNALQQQHITDLRQLDDTALVDLAVKFSAWLPESTFVRAPWLAPFAIRRLRVRVDDRAPGDKRDLWGFPDLDGWFSDDNSLIKGVVKGLAIGPDDGPYGGQRVARGLVCCHVWAGTTNDPLLFSFVPNLVWMPKSLAPYSDAHGTAAPHPVHDALKAISLNRYRSLVPQVATQRVAAAWQKLPLPIDPQRSSSTPSTVLAGDRIVTLVDSRIRKMIDFLTASLDPVGAPPKRFSRRYHAGVGAGIDHTVWPVQQAVPESARRALIVDLQSCRELL